MKSRLPDLASLTSVYAIIVVMFYGWSLIAFIWKLPSWLNYLSVGELLVILAYTLTSGLFESLSILGVLTLAAIILPGRLLRQDFIVRGVVIVVCLAGFGMAFLARYVRVGQGIVDVWGIWLIAAFSALAGMLFVTNRWPPARRAIVWLADQTTIFLFILMPLSIISLFFVLYWNLL